MLIFALALALPGAAGCGGDDGYDKADLLEALEKEWDAEKIPAPLSECMVRQLSYTVTDAEVEEASESVPGNASGAEIVTALGPDTVPRIAVVCGKQLLQTGEFSHAELEKAVARLANP